MRKSSKKWVILSIIAGVFTAIVLISTVCLYFRKEEQENYEFEERQYTEIEI